MRLSSPKIFACALALGSVLLVATGATAGPLERVPEDGSLQSAIQRVSNGGTIDIAPGVYAAPSGGFRIRNKAVRIAARGGGGVVLDGQGTAAIFEIENQGVGTGESVAFEGITFRGGFSNDVTRAGAVTVDSGQAVFVSCLFDSNAAVGNTARGGAVIARSSIVRVVSSRFLDNTSGQWGAGIFAIQDSKVFVLWSEFIGNRTDLPNHGQVPAGGAIYVLDSEAHVRGSYFENNASGWVGGALYALSDFQAPLAVPAAVLTIENSTFVGNRAFPDACCIPPGPPAGGAIHVENQARVTVTNSRFFENESNFGGAISSYRAEIVVHDSVFRGNRAIPFQGTVGAGGALNVTSTEFPDATNNNGNVNRPDGSLLVTNSLIQGRFGSTGVAAQQAGCVFAAGDAASFLGLGGMPQNGSAADNRSPVLLRGVVLADCDVETGAEGPGLGGAVFTNLADLTIDDSIIVDSDALGDGGAGGAVFGLGNSVVRATNTAFARNSAEVLGGALRMVGGEIQVDDCFFLENDVTPGVAESVQSSPGAAMTLAPANDLDLVGTVQNSVFTDNVGIPIVDVATSSGFFNNVVYNGNEIHSTTFGSDVYKNQEVGFGGLNVNELNNLVLNRPGGSFTKSTVDNSFLPNAPREARLVAAPSAVNTTSTPGDAAGPTSVFLGHAWAGGASALNGMNLPEQAGIVEVNTPGAFSQTVDGQAQASVDVGENPCSGDGTLCLTGERFFVELDFRTFNNNVGNAFVVPQGTADSGLYFFFDEENWEVLVKVLNGCSITNHFWVFAAATTNVEYTLRVTDKVTGLTKSYFNPLGNAASAITDTQALAACSKAAEPESLRAQRLGPEPLSELELSEVETWIAEAVEAEPPDDTAKQGTCVVTATELCLLQNRFRLEVDWRTPNGNTGKAQTTDIRVDGSGTFFFFTSDNLEMLVKVLNGCSINNFYWVFAAATTNVQYTLKVTDTVTGATKSFFNPQGVAAVAVTDTQALDACP